MTRAIALVAAAAVVLGLLAGVYYVFGMRGSDRFAACREGVVAGGTAQVGGPFALLDPEGRTVSEVEAITRPTLVYFGYTFCPDFCPTDLARNAVAADLLAEQGIEVGMVFITIDPERDTPEVMGEYAAAIHPEILGLSGTAEAVKAAADAYRVFYRKASDDEFYLMEHSTFTYLMAPEVGFLDFFGSDVTAEDVAERTACFTRAL